MAARRSTQLVVIGVSIFVIGTALVFLGLRGGDEPAAAPASRSSAPAKTTAPPERVITVQGANAAVNVPIPKGLQAVAVNMPRVAGLAGYAKPGDTLNIYATVKSGAGEVENLSVPYAKLVLSNVKVIDVKNGEDGKGDILYLLALDARDAERAIFYAKFESLWATLVPAGQEPARTRGVDHARGL